MHCCMLRLLVYSPPPWASPSQRPVGGVAAAAQLRKPAVAARSGCMAGGGSLRGRRPGVPGFFVCLPGIRSFGKRRLQLRDLRILHSNSSRVPSRGCRASARAAPDQLTSPMSSATARTDARRSSNGPRARVRVRVPVCLSGFGQDFWISSETKELRRLSSKNPARTIRRAWR